jgi:hypothetical protein
MKARIESLSYPTGMIDNASIPPGWYWSHSIITKDDELVPADYPLAYNHGPYVCVLDAYNAAQPNPPGQCVVLLHAGQLSGLLRVDKPTDHAVFEPALESSLSFTQHGDVIEAKPPGAAIRIELLLDSPVQTGPDRFDRAHVLLCLEGLAPISLTVNHSPVYDIVTEACSVASALYWSRQRAVNGSPKTWSLAA